MNKSESIQKHCAQQLELVSQLTKNKKAEVEALLEQNHEVLESFKSFEDADAISKQVGTMLNDVDQTLTAAMTSLSEQLGVPSGDEHPQSK